VGSLVTVAYYYKCSPDSDSERSLKIRKKACEVKAYKNYYVFMLLMCTMSP